MLFKTETGSVYEVNLSDKQIRRVTGVETPTPRQGKDGDWRTYSSLSGIKVGDNVMIVWGNDVKLLPETEQLVKAIGGFGVSTTVTSRVVEVVK